MISKEQKIAATKLDLVLEGYFQASDVDRKLGIVVTRLIQEGWLNLEVLEQIKQRRGLDWQKYLRLKVAQELSVYLPLTEEELLAEQTRTENEQVTLTDEVYSKFWQLLTFLYDLLRDRHYPASAMTVLLALAELASEARGNLDDHEARS